MRCPFCKTDDDKVIDSRASNDGFAIRRRRECTACERRFTTYERIEESPLRVVKKDEHREPFDRRKILFGLIKACEKRPIPIPVLEDITTRIENRVLEEYENEVPSTYLGELVMEELRHVDQVAYVRFASVYREFEDVTEFMRELEVMLDRRRVVKDGGKEAAPAARRGRKGKGAAGKKAADRKAAGARKKQGGGAPRPAGDEGA
jgi:transcriptional repressor NrdR